MARLTVLPLLEALRDHADRPELYDLLVAPASGCASRRVRATRSIELWLVAWAPGAATGYHDHDAVTGAHTVLTGAVAEYAGDSAYALGELGPGDSRSYAPGYVHDLRNLSEEPALTLHAYSPPRGRLFCA